MDLLRFIWASCTILTALYWSYNIAWSVLGAIWFIGTKWIKFPVTQIGNFLVQNFFYYLLLGVFLATRDTWAKDYPGIAVPMTIVLSLNLLIFSFGNAAQKYREFREATIDFYQFDSQHGDSYATNDEWLKKYDLMKEYEKFINYHATAACVSLVMVIVSWFAPSIFLTPPVDFVQTWLSLVFKIPVLPFILAVVGLWTAFGFVMKIVTFVGIGGFMAASAIHDKYTKDPEIIEAEPETSVAE